MIDAEAIEAARACGVPGDAVLVPVPRAGSRARVWRVDGRDGASWLKLPGSERAWRNELRALTEWAPTMGARVPHVLGTQRTRPWALLLSRVDGAPVEARTPDPEVFEAAGRALTALHRCAFRDADPVALDVALDARWRAWWARAGRAGLRLDPALGKVWADRPRATCPRTPCHRDFAPRNWVWSDHEGLGVIDFGAAGPDHPWRDLLPLWESELLGEADAAAAFVRGYGQPLPFGTDEFLCLALLHCVGTLAWAAEHADPTYARTGRRGLERLGYGAG